MKKITTVSQAFKRYYEEHVSHVAIDYTRPLVAWRKLEPYFGNIRLKDLKGSVFSSYVQKRKRSAGTINREFGVLSAALRWCHLQGYIDQLILVPRLPTPPPRQRWLSKKETAKLIRASEKYPHVHSFIAIALLTGQRKEAILELKWEQVNFSDGYIDFHSDNPSSVRQKGRAVIPISKEMKEFLQGLTVNGPYVVHNNGHRIRDMRKAWLNVLAEANLKDVTPHTLRHTVATHLVQDRVPIIEIAKLLGHKDSRITEKVYAKFGPDYLKKAVSSLSLDL